MTSASFTPSDPDFEGRVRRSFARQGLMDTIGAALTAVRPGEVVITLPVAPAISQQHGFVHGGAVTAIVDSACGYAALSLMPPSTGVLAAEFKVNLLAPAAGDRLVATGRVVKPGRTLTVAQGEVTAETDAGRKVVAIMTATFVTLQRREGVRD